MAMRRWQEMVAVLAGLWLFISPWTLGYAGPARTNAFIIGIIVVIASPWAQVNEGAVQHSHQPV